MENKEILNALPDSIKCSESLSSSAKKLLGALIIWKDTSKANKAKETGHIIIGSKQLMRYFQMGYNTIISARAELKQKGYIQDWINGNSHGKGAEYILADSILKLVDNTISGDGKQSFKYRIANYCLKPKIVERSKFLKGLLEEMAKENRQKVNDNVDGFKTENRLAKLLASADPECCKIHNEYPIIFKKDDGHEKGYIYDFFIEYENKGGKHLIDVEVDGITHDSKEQKEHDEERDNFAKKNNILVIRLKPYMVWYYENLLNDKDVKETATDLIHLWSVYETANIFMILYKDAVMEFGIKQLENENKELKEKLDKIKQLENENKGLKNENERFSQLLSDTVLDTEKNKKIEELEKENKELKSLNKYFRDESNKIIELKEKLEKIKKLCN